MKLPRLAAAFWSVCFVAGCKCGQAPPSTNCPQGTSECSGNCVQVATDDANCGSCGNACPTGLSCADGACFPKDCADLMCSPDSVCVSDHCVTKNCVGVSCPGAEVCSQGTCVCGSGGIVCGGSCVNGQTDDQNCGDCGKACATGTKCAGGVCYPADCASLQCDPDSVCYQGACVQAACVGVTCSGGMTCLNGTCRCPAPKSDCGGICAALATDSANCGACGKACASGQGCAAGACVQGCQAGQSLCTGKCVDTQTDTSNCGACGAACGGGRNCVAGNCACPQSLTLCGTTCVNLVTDGSNCGSCGVSCGAGSCASSSCQCAAGSVLCGTACTDLQTDTANCGKCGNNCPAGQSCRSGGCVCGAGTTLCSGACISTTSDNLNCGGCGVVCPSGTTCANSGCVAPFTCQTNFNTPPAGCSAFPLDTTKCGVPSQTSSTPWTGSTGSTPASFPLTVAPGESVTVTGTSTGLSSVSVVLRDSLTNSLATTNYTSPGGFTLSTTGSAYSCASPVDAVIVGGATFTYNLQVEINSMSGKYNTGSNAVPTATALAVDPTSQRVCDQICGDLKRHCGDSRQYSAFTLPAGKAADLQLAFVAPFGSFNYNFSAFQADGNLICNLVFNQIGGSTMAFYTARLVNNSATDQPVVISPDVWGGGGDFVWNVAVGVE